MRHATHPCGPYGYSTCRWANGIKERLPTLARRLLCAAAPFYLVSSNLQVANLAMGYFCLKFMRYLLLFWLPFYHNVQLGYDSQAVQPKPGGG